MSRQSAASTRATLGLAGGRATAKVKSQALNISHSFPVQTVDATHLTFPVGDNWAAAREAFLTRHGPRAIFPRRPALSKELRKTLLATEMAAWEAA
jgi:hypothetical protein